ncbi:MAG: Membrane protein containing HD superfamily hydrolase domain, YQFF ortholog [uncultured Phycisphaerae bacterium]|uniref:Membrane protein containing HD superfamily hydrolase domain, YQFF ortholog n=1 Tax=uncultured Phycisphaerae bacterium TaxID=904963 RepID=A0A6J4QDF3_9BACT|nr:MAG: Membrane protein containing HD superfamily hydrolase domain, YQFF ortholog [uncultured Phycisphaerae bacterium]
MEPGKSRSRREEIRKNRPDAARLDWEALRANGVLASLGIAAAFCVLASGILMLRQEVVRYRPNQWVPHDIVSRVDFTYFDSGRVAAERAVARLREPRVYVAAAGDTWDDLRRDLLALPTRVANAPPDALLADLAGVLDAGAVTLLRQYATDDKRADYEARVGAFVDALRRYTVRDGAAVRRLLVLPSEPRAEDLDARRPVAVAGESSPVDPAVTFTPGDEALRQVLAGVAERHFTLAMQPKVVDVAMARLRPTHEYDARQTAEVQNLAERRVPDSVGNVRYPANAILVPKTDAKPKFTQDDWELLRAENNEYLASVEGWGWKSKLGLAVTVLIITVALSASVANFQPRLVRNHARALALAALLLSMLLVAQLAGIGNGPIYLFGVAPTILTAMILTISYDQRFAIGISSMHGLLVTVALGQGVSFFIVLWVGVLTSCFLLDDLRTRSKLIEVGGAAALAMIGATAGGALLSLEPWPFVLFNCLHAAAAGLATGCVVLGILPFIEKAFRITTGMTLLELADASQPLLRRLAMEAPGTYAHSLQVANLAETAAEAIGANALLARVGAYYHDVGKMNKADYFIENQSGGENRHLNLNPNVSFLIITGHVKDGVEMAKEYNLPTSLVSFIQQHHGTTLVEYFYHQARTQQSQREPGGPAVADHQYRYPGPRPRTKEVAIVMIADAVESACRAMSEPTASRVETLVHELALKRLLDGQFDECELTMRELDQIERSMVKTLLGIYHGRIAYPSMDAMLSPAAAATPGASDAVVPGAARTA